MGNFETQGLLICLSSLGDNVKALFQRVVAGFSQDLEWLLHTCCLSLFFLSVCMYMERQHVNSILEH